MAKTNLVSDNATVSNSLDAQGSVSYAYSAKTEGAPTSIDLFGLPFSDGLTITLIDKDINVLVIYE